MRIRFASSLLVAVLLVACSGSSPSDLFSNSTDGGATGTGTGTGTSDGGTSVTDASPGFDASQPDGSKPDTGSVSCGATLTCPLGDTCCANGAAAPYRFECKAGKVECAAPSVDIQCDSAEDCAGAGSADICCGDRVTEGGRTTYRSLSCRSSCNGGNVTFCNPTKPAASCGQGQRCGASTILPGYFTCQ